MNIKQKLLYAFGLSLLFMNDNTLMAKNMPHMDSVPNQIFNQLNWLDISNGPSVQLLFDFAKPIYFKKKSIPDHHQIKLSFPGMKLQYFNPKYVMNKLEKLKKDGLVEQISLDEKTTKYPKVELILTFAKKRAIKQKDGVTHIDNDLLIKWSKLEEPNRLIIDIFTKDALQKIEKKQNNIMLAHREKKKLPKSLKIVLDAGHGGQDPGAQSFGLKEKDLALDITMRTRALLKKRGFTTLLTRNADETLPLAERVDLANQLKANLFVAIHLNASPLGNKQGGVETFHMPTPSLPSKTPQNSGFLTLNSDKNAMQLVEGYFQEQHNASKNLALSIQNNVLNAIKTEYKQIKDRGIKENNFRIFFNNTSPTTLVEVGFLTNPQEAKLLAHESYRNRLAQGIYKGIIDYLQRQNV